MLGEKLEKKITYSLGLSVRLAQQKGKGQKTLKIALLTKKSWTHWVLTAREGTKLIIFLNFFSLNLILHFVNCFFS